MKPCPSPLVVTIAFLVLASAAPGAQRGGPRPAVTELVETDLDAPLRRVDAVLLRAPLTTVRGYAALNGRHLVATVEPRGRDERTGEPAGRAHLCLFDAQGIRLRDQVISEGTFFVPGGLFHDGDRLLVPVAEYRAQGRTRVLQIDPATLAPRLLFTFPEPLALVAPVPGRPTFNAIPWRGDTLHEVDRRGRPVATMKLSHRLTGLRDGVRLPSGALLVSGAQERGRGVNAAAVGWLAAVAPDGRVLVQVPLADRTARGRVLTAGGMDLVRGAFGLRLALVPSDPLPHVITVELVADGRHPRRHMDRLLAWAHREATWADEEPLDESPVPTPDEGTNEVESNEEGTDGTP